MVSNISSRNQKVMGVNNSAGIQASLAGRYAVALFELAAEAGSVSAVERDLANLQQALAESPELRQLIASPKVSREKAQQALADIGLLLDLSQLTRNFVGVLASNRRLGKLADIISAFQQIAAAQRGEITAHVVSAHGLSDEQLDALKLKLTQREGRTVKLSASVDPELLGGLVVTIGSQRIDGSIRTRLNSLAQAMKAA